MFTVPKGQEGQNEEDEDMSMDYPHDPQDYDEDEDDVSEIIPEGKNSKVKDNKM